MLPPMGAEVLLTIFDGVDFATLFASSHVCRSWRAAARNHPLFWKELTFDDHSLTSGEVMLFVDRLTAKHTAHSTISLSMRLTAPRQSLNALVVSAMVLPLLREHLHRVEELALIVAPAYAAEIWPLFVIPAPNLRNLQVSTDRKASLDPLPGLFNAHEFDNLEQLYLVDVALPKPPQPFQHILKGLKVSYSFAESSYLQQTLSWIPHGCEMLDLRIHSCPAKTAFPPLPNLTTTQKNILQHFVVNHTTWLDELPHRRIPVLSVSNIMVKHESGRIELLMPRAVALAICFGRKYNCDGHIWHRTGSLVIASSNGREVRQFWIRTELMSSVSFLRETIDAHRLVTLVSPIDLAFRTLCDNAYHLPRLTTLRLLLNALPDPMTSWASSAIQVPALAKIILQREMEHPDATVSAQALEQFLGKTVGVHDWDAICVVIQDIRLTGYENNLGGMHIQFQKPSADWGARHKDGRPEVNRMKHTFRGPDLDWMQS